MLSKTVGAFAPLRVAPRNGDAHVGNGMATTDVPSSPKRKIKLKERPAGTEITAQPRKPFEHNLTEQKIAEFREAFSLFDKDGDGHVTPGELTIVLQTLGQKPTAEEVNAMIQEVDDDNNGAIEFEEFVQLMTKNMKGNDDADALMEAFKILDADGSGSIDHHELKEILRSFSKLGEDIPDEEIDHMIREADVDGDGSISYEEFVKVMMKNDG